MIDALVVYPDGYAAVRAVDGSLESWRECIGGGWLEAISGPGWCAFVDEEGKLKDLPPNLPADALARELGWLGAPWDILAGPVVFAGPPDDNGDTTTVPIGLVALAFAGQLDRTED
jgi:hypothetical protein